MKNLPGIVVSHDGSKKPDTILLALSILSQSEETILPELYAIVGPDKFLEFLETFAGLEIKMPSPKLIMDAIDDCYIIKAVRNTRSLKELRATYKNLASKYNTSVEVVKKRSARMNSIIKRYPIS